MFSGIVEEMGEVVSDLAGSRTRLKVRCPALAPACQLGDSVGVNGCCLTVVAVDGTDIEFDVMPETSRRTNLAGLHTGDSVNLEGSLRYGDRVGGHMVSGHVDAVARVISAQTENNAVRVSMKVPEDLAPLIAAQGCIAVDGISLTVTDVDKDVFGVSLIPHTLEVTNASRWREGSSVNVEVDMLARYMARMMQAERAGATA